MLLQNLGKSTKLAQKYKKQYKTVQKTVQNYGKKYKIYGFIEILTTYIGSLFESVWYLLRFDSFPPILASQVDRFGLDSFIDFCLLSSEIF